MSTKDARAAATQAGVNLVEFDEKTEVPNSTLALTDAEALNKLAFSALAPDWVKNQTHDQDISPEERERYEEQKRQIERRYEQLMRELDEQDAIVTQRINDLHDHAIVLSNGQRAYVGPDGKFYYEDGRRIEEKFEQEAEEAHQANGGTTSKLTDIQEANRDKRDIDEKKRKIMNDMHDEQQARVGQDVWTPNGLKSWQTSITASDAQSMKDADSVHEMIVEQNRRYQQAAEQNFQATVIMAKQTNAGAAATADRKNTTATTSSFNDLGSEYDEDDTEPVQSASQTTRLTSVANQIDPASSDITIKPVFTASASPTPATKTDPAPSPGTAPKQANSPGVAA
jgi:hypothetical protein